MVVYVLKFSACLAIFMVFYSFFLEKENMHHLKRYYLLAAVFIALSIPLITFTTYIEPIITDNIELQSFQEFGVQDEIVEGPMNYLPIILWSLYGLGIFLFGLKFISNLYKIISKIKRNPKHKGHYTYVLLKDLITPHTFLKFIFLNQQKFEAREIPQEVFMHEEAHAKQKHSIDILLMEVLQIIFWFNPLIYFTKKSIKLNHEFLADQAVLKQGIEPSTYQQILLTFSSNVTEPKLANAINYSSIKKRFTVMKTHTSKQKIWLRSFLLLPLIALTLYGFSEKKNIEKQSIKTNLAEISNLKKNPVLEISFNPDIFKLNGRDTSLSELKKAFIKATNGEKSDLDIKTVGSINMSLITNIMGELKGNLLKINLDERAYIISDNMTTDNQQKATPKEVAEYNKMAKHYNAQNPNDIIIKQKDVERMKYLYNKMSKDQKASAEPFPNIVPPPPPTQKEIDAYNTWAKKIHSESTPISDKATLLPIVVEQDLIKFSAIFNRMSLQQKNQSVKFPFSGLNIKENEQNFPLVPPPPPPIPADATPAQKKKMQAIIDDYNTNVPPPPPPPAPKTPLDYVIEMAKKGAAFYNEGKSISSDEAIKLLKKNNDLNIQSKESDSNNPKIYISKDPFVIKQ